MGKVISLTFVLMAIIVLAVSGTSYFYDACSASSEDTEIYNEFVTIKGKVTILNHPELGVTPFNGAYVVFQRTDCKRCLVATHADIDGKYQVRVGKGRYKLVMYNPSPPTVDLLAPNQPRYVEAKNILEDTVFDINVAFPNNK